MKVKILDKFNYMTLPIVEGMIEVDEEILTLISEKVKYCFDVENNRIIDYDNTAQLQKQAYEQEYQEKLDYLHETDYVANKLSEAVAEYIANGDSTNVIVLRANYKEVLEKRQQYRDRLDEIKELLVIYEEKGI